MKPKHTVRCDRPAKVSRMAEGTCNAQMCQSMNSVWISTSMSARIGDLPDEKLRRNFHKFPTCGGLSEVWDGLEVCSVTCCALPTSKIGNCQEDRTPQLTMATKFRHKLLQRWCSRKSLASRTIYGQFVAILKGTFKNLWDHRYPKDSCLVVDLQKGEPRISRSTRHRLGLQLVHINYWEWSRLSEDRGCSLQGLASWN